MSEQVWKIGDCLELLPGIPDNSIDLVFADPPFNVKKKYGDVGNDNKNNYNLWCSKWISECFRVLKPTGSFYLMTITKHLDFILPEMSTHGVFINLISWRNVSGAIHERSFWNEYQPIVFYGKTDGYKFNRYTQVSDRGARRWGKYSTEFKGQIMDRWDDINFVYAGGVIHPEAILKKGTKKKAHPAQMPRGIVERAIKFSTDVGDTVLDPFAGSGTTLRVCRETDRNGIGIELEPKNECIIKEHLLVNTPRLDTWDCGAIDKVA